MFDLLLRGDDIEISISIHGNLTPAEAMKQYLRQKPGSLNVPVVIVLGISLVLTSVTGGMLASSVNVDQDKEPASQGL